jgi:hypothetical protein
LLFHAFFFNSQNVVDVWVHLPLALLITQVVIMVSEDIFPIIVLAKMYI